MAVDFENVDIDLLKNYEELLRSYYLGLNPDADVSNGSVIHELVIRPAAAIYARNEKALETLKTQYSLNLLAQTENPDPDLAENLAANFKVERRDGTKGSGTVAVYTNQNASDVYMGVGTEITAGGVVLELPHTYVGVSSLEGYEDTDDVKYRELMKMGSGEYAFLAGVVTAEPTSASVPEGTPATTDVDNSLVVRMEVASAVGGGSDEETTQDLVDRVIHGITAKVPSGKAHIEAMLKESEIVDVIDLVVTGMRDPEMLRDRNNVFMVGTGGRADAWCRTSALPSTTTIVKTAESDDGGSTWRMHFDRSEAPGWYYIARIAHSDNPKVITDSNEISLTFGYQNVDGGPEVFSGVTARYSPYQTADAVFVYEGLGTSSTEFMVDLVAMPRLEDIQSLLDAPAVRNPQQDVLARGLVPAFVGIDMALECRGDKSGVDVDKIKEDVAAFVNGLPAGRGFLSVADLAVVVNASNPNLTMTFPAGLSLSTYMPDGSLDVRETSEGVIEPVEDLSIGVSGRVTAFFCRVGDVDVIIKD